MFDGLLKDLAGHVFTVRNSRPYCRAGELVCPDPKRLRWVWKEMVRKVIGRRWK
jgi:hypothetical protein